MTEGKSTYDVRGKNIDIFYFVLFVQSMTMIPFLIITRLDRNRESFIAFLILPIFGYLLTFYLLQINKNENTLFRNHEFWIYTILIRIIILFIPLGMSDDIYRYLWEGHLQHQGINPYQFSPDSSELIANRTSWWNRVNNQDIHSPYPPVAQIIFFVLTFVSSDLSILIISFRIVMICFDLAVIGVIKRLLKIFDLPEKRIIIYAWSPLVLFEISGNAHIDVIAVFFLLLSIYLILQNSQLERNKIFSGISLAIAFLVKFFPLMILPFIVLKWGIKGVLSFIGTVVIFTSLYIKAGVNPLYPKGLRIFADYFRFNESIFRVYRHVIFNSFNIQNADLVARDHYRFLMMTFSFLTILYFYRNQKKSKNSVDISEYVKKSIASYQFLVLTALLFGPDIQPWYLLWLLPLSLLFLDWAVIAFSVTVLLSYQIYPEYAKTHIWKENHLILLAEYALIYAILVSKFLKRFEIKTANLKQ